MSRKSVHLRRDLLDFYKGQINNTLLPFWHRAVDTENGGVFTCYSNDGSTLISKDKYTWSQGRFLWLWSRLASMINKKCIEGNKEVYLAQANKTANFLMDHVFLPNGNCAFLLNEKGNMKESVLGKGYDTSFYADCFVILGMAEYIRVTKKSNFLQPVLNLYDRIVDRLQTGEVRSEPYPIPTGYRSHSVSMIMLNVTQELGEVLVSLNHKRSQEIKKKSLLYMHEIMDKFLLEEGRIVELLTEDPSKRDTLLSQHVNPGHAIECMWFVMISASRVGNKEVIERAAKVIKWAFQIGWDEEHGGLFRFVDCNGGQPAGRLIDDPYEKLILDTWDTKLWWPHSETLYATLLGYSLTHDLELLFLYDSMEKYVFRTFPNPNTDIGEWIQIRARNAEPINKVVALPVKDPYHILRNMLLIVELLYDKTDIMGCS
ncbi:AGE family epimerase/isomerase [Litchfieldia alkalitelluris]|uniref:AGE family epimerase/isomerase n=1 Tax=Litchfieldia alkalitelluris TaxID=304268 RepID=UPI0009962C35|nr:AGE family epimerase/isomerase [Litchfieldia alkalitelluris]